LSDETEVRPKSRAAIDRLLRKATNVGNQEPPPGPRHFSNWLQAFVNYASYSEAPLLIYFWVGVSTIAGALRRKVWIDQVNFQWLPNFYTIIVAPPGIIAKSTSIDIGIDILKRVPGINFGPDVLTWQHLVTSMGEAVETFKVPATGEIKTMSPITIASSELGNLINPDDREQIDALISLWDGRKEFKKGTKTQGSDVLEYPWLNIIGATTPSWIANSVPQHMIGGGFMSRCVFLFADEKRQYVPFLDECVPRDHEETRTKLVEDLHRISAMAGSYTIHPGAREIVRAWYIEHYKNPPKGLNREQFGGYLARKQTHIMKLSMVLAAAQRNELVIMPDDISTAMQLVNGLEENMPRIYERMGAEQQTRGQMELVALVRQEGKISETDLFKRLFRILSHEDFVKAAQSAATAKLIKMQNEGKITFFYPGENL
jgi:hypothetical protein